MKKNHILISLVVGLLLAGSLSYAAWQSPPVSTIFQRASGVITSKTATDTLGGASDRWDYIYADNIDTTILTVSTVVSGNINMDDNAILWASYIQAGYFTGTSTTPSHFGGGFISPASSTITYLTTELSTSTSATSTEWLYGGTITDGSFIVTGGAISGASGNISMWTNDEGYLQEATASSTYSRLDEATSTMDGWGFASDYLTWANATDTYSQLDEATSTMDGWEATQTARGADDLSDDDIDALQNVAAMSEALGDLMYYGESGWTNLATGTANQLLKINSTTGYPEWGTGTDDLSDDDLDALQNVNAIVESTGGLLYVANGNQWDMLASSTNGYVLTVSDIGYPSWANPTTTMDYWETIQTSRGTDDLSDDDLDALQNVNAIAESTGGILYVADGNQWDMLASSTEGYALVIGATGYPEWADSYLKNDGDIGTGVFDFGGATSFEIPNAAAPTVDAAGEIAIDITEDQLVYYGGGKRVLSATSSMSFALESPVAGDQLHLWKVPYDITITDIHCLTRESAGAVTTIGLDLFESGADGTSSSTVDAFITCDVDGAEDDGSLANGTIDGGDWLGAYFETASGTASWVTVTAYYEIDAK